MIVYWIYNVDRCLGFASCIVCQEVGCVTLRVLYANKRVQ